MSLRQIVPYYKLSKQWYKVKLFQVSKMKGTDLMYPVVILSGRGFLVIHLDYFVSIMSL